MTTPIIDPSTQKAIDEIEDLKRKIWMQSMGFFIVKPEAMFLYNLTKHAKLSKWQRLKAWIKNKLK